MLGLVYTSVRLWDLASIHEKCVGPGLMGSLALHQRPKPTKVDPPKAVPIINTKDFTKLQLGEAN